VTDAMAAHLDRAAFAAAVLLAEATDPHDRTFCRLTGHCRLHEALAASVERIAREGRALAVDGRTEAPP
jgi:hypothetical protein